MPDTGSINGIDMANIASINGQTVPSGGGGVAESTNGVLYFEPGGFNTANPDAQEFFGDSAVGLYKVQISSRTDIVRIKMNSWHIFALDSSGNLYSAGYTNTTYMGRVSNSTNAHILTECLTGVSKFSPHVNGCWAIKTDGTLWWCGLISDFANSTDTGRNTTTSSNGWLQYGSDSDWIDIDCFPNFPAGSMAIKGSAGSEYVYSCGNNFFGRLGVGTTSGSTKPWTRVKSAASTDWSETIDKVSIGYDGTMFVTKSGKLFACGEGAYGMMGQGNNTDQYYVIQVGTDTDWALPYAKARTAAYCIKTNGALYGSTSSAFSWGIVPTTTDYTYRQIGTDTDYEDLRTIEHISSWGEEFLFAKKNGSWDNVNWDNTIVAPSWTGSETNQSPPSTNTWVSINTLLAGNGITTTISDVALTWKNNSLGSEIVALFATQAT